MELRMHMNLSPLWNVKDGFSTDDLLTMRASLNRQRHAYGVLELNYPTPKRMR